jgi:hypothetical protein
MAREYMWRRRAKEKGQRSRYKWEWCRGWDEEGCMMAGNGEQSKEGQRGMMEYHRLHGCAEWKREGSRARV